MPPPAAREAGSRDPRERAGKGAQSAESREKRAKGAPAREPPKPGWALSLEGLEAMSPKQCHRHLLFGDLLEDVGAAASIFPRESAELGYRMPDPRAWTQSLEPSTARQDRLLGVLKAAEARGRVRALRLRYTYMRVRRGASGRGGHARRWGSLAGDRRALRKRVRVAAGRGCPAGESRAGPTLWGSETPHAAPDPQAEEISLLIQRQKSARAAIRLELFLPPQLKPTRIPDPLDRQEVPGNPGRGGGGPPTALHTWPQPLSRSGGAWRPFWRRKWTAGTSCADGQAHWRPHPTSPIKFWFPEACWSLCAPSRPLGGKRVTEWGISNKAGRCKGGVSGRQGPGTPLTSQTQSCPPAGEERGEPGPVAVTAPWGVGQPMPQAAGHATGVQRGVMLWAAPWRAADWAALRRTQRWEEGEASPCALRLSFPS